MFFSSGGVADLLSPENSCYRADNRSRWGGSKSSTAVNPPHMHTAHPGMGCIFGCWCFSFPVGQTRVGWVSPDLCAGPTVTCQHSELRRNPITSKRSVKTNHKERGFGCQLFGGGGRDLARGSAKSLGSHRDPATEKTHGGFAPRLPGTVLVGARKWVGT